MALLRREIETPLLAVCEHCHRYTLMEGVLEQLAVSTVGLTCLFHLHEYNRSCRRIAESEVHPTAGDRVLWRDDRRPENRPAQVGQQWENRALLDGCLVGERAGLDGSPNLSDPVSKSHRGTSQLHASL